MSLTKHPFPPFVPPAPGCPAFIEYFRAFPPQYAYCEPGVVTGNGAGYRLLRDEIDWQHRVEARSEAFMSDPIRDYTYGKGGGERTYTSVPFHPQVKLWMQSIHGVTEQMYLHHELPADYVCSAFNACFLNRYDGERQALGWHADDSPGQDHEHPIAVFTTGQPREIWWRPKGHTGPIPAEWRQLLTPGSLFIMPGGFQQTHEHRIPKGDRKMGTRISLTYRSFT